MPGNTVHKSDNYIWSTADLLGQGAYGEVYRARGRKNGMLYAVKTFNSQSAMIPKEVRMREFEVLRKLHHENIVQLLTVEKDLETKREVLITELCTGGSLQNMLKDPENYFGLEEQEFLNVMRDIARGMEHIRQQDVVHRDIKPGNIMRYNTDDGRSIYKLIDFGASRELPQDGQFQSLVGTPEYLFPDMYECALIKRSAYGAKFGASIDLWSVGVTLYHVATGNLPFRPYEGRNDHACMHKITTEKVTGVISGVQNDKGGKITWSKKLPTTCRLSTGLKNLVTPLLASLLEYRQDLMLTFEQFFQIVADIGNKRLVHVFCVNTCEILHVYCNQNAQLAEFRELIRQQVDVPDSNQKLFYENHSLDKIVKVQQTVETYPITTIQQPIFLLIENSTIENDQVEIPESVIPDLPLICGPRDTEYDRDFNLAQNIVAIVQCTARATRDVILKQQLICKATKMYLLIFSREVELFREKIREMALRVNEIEKRLTLFSDTQTQLASILATTRALRGEEARGVDCTFESQSRNMEHFAKLRQQVNDITSKTNELASTVDTSLTERGSLLLQSCCQDTDNCTARLDILLNSIKQTTNAFKKDSKESISLFDKQIHDIDKMKLNSSKMDAVQRFQEHCLKNLKDVFQKFTEWYREVEIAQRKRNDYDEESEMAYTRVDLVTRTVDQSCTERNERINGMMAALKVKQVALVDLTRSFSAHSLSIRSTEKSPFVFVLHKKKRSSSAQDQSLPLRESSNTSAPRFSTDDGEDPATLKADHEPPT